MLSSWERKQQQGAPRHACLECGTHALVWGSANVRECPCCGAPQMGAVVEADAMRRRRQAERGARRTALHPPALS
jgi:predicted metal-binding transcription factor (methanogenesis marker protein 9)